MNISDDNPLLLHNLLAAKAQTSPAEYLGASVRMLDGFGTKGAKAWPFNYHAAVRSFGSWVYRAAMLRAKAVAKVKLRLYVRTPTGVRKARDFKTKSAWRMAVLERLDAASSGDLRPGDGDGVLMFNTRPVDVRRKRFLAGDVRGGAPGDRVLAKVAEFGGDGFEEVTEPHPALQVLSTVNPWMNGFELSILRWVYLLLTGNAYLHPVIDPRSGVPSEVWPMPSQWVSVLPSRETLIRGYAYGPEKATAKEFAPDEVIQWRLPNPEDPFFYGKGCVEAVWTALGLHKDKRVMDAAKFQNMARPDWLLVVKGGNGDALNRLESAVDQKLRGAHNTGRMLAVNGDGVTATALNLPVDEIGDADRVIEEIATGFEIPVSMLLGNDPIKANSETAVAGFLRDTVLPDTVMDAEKLNERWLPLFGVGDDAVLAYDSPMIDDAELELKRVTQLRQFGIIDGNEAREEEGYGPHADGDALLFAGKPIGDSAIEAATAVAEATAPDPAQAAGNDTPPAKPARGKAAVAIETKVAGGEHWVTINGTHVLIGGDGKIKEGPEHLIGMTHAEASAKLGEVQKPEGADRTSPQSQSPQRSGGIDAYVPPSPEDLKGNSIYLWHGTSAEAAEKIAKTRQIGSGPRGRNASADVVLADQFPEDTGAESLVLVHADPKSLTVDPNDQIGETVEEGLFPKGFGSSTTLGKHTVVGIFDVRGAKTGYREALQKGDWRKAKKLGVKIRSFERAAPAEHGGKSLKSFDGRWVTLNGVHVLIASDGTIAAGPSGMIGRTPASLGNAPEAGTPSPDDLTDDPYRQAATTYADDVNGRIATARTEATGAARQYATDANAKYRALSSGLPEEADDARAAAAEQATRHAATALSPHLRDALADESQQSGHAELLASGERLSGTDLADAVSDHVDAVTESAPADALAKVPAGMRDYVQAHEGRVADALSARGKLDPAKVFAETDDGTAYVPQKLATHVVDRANAIFAHGGEHDDELAAAESAYRQATAGVRGAAGRRMRELADDAADELAQSGKLPRDLFHREYHPVPGDAKVLARAGWTPDEARAVARGQMGM